jgi:methionyl-tRNA formyltransferase
MVEIVFLGINNFGEEIYQWLCGRDDADVAALLTEESQLSLVRTINPDLLISAGFRHIVPEDILSIPNRGAVNLHPSYLPYNRGANPNVWSIVESTPAGVTIHRMTPEVDAGDIVAQRRIEKRPNDTGKMLYERQNAAMVDLFVESWPAIRDDEADETPQDGDGTFHTKTEFPELFELDLDAEKPIGDVIRRLRALTYPPYDNAYFEVDGERYYVEITVTPEGETDPTPGIHWNVPDYSDET